MNFRDRLRVAWEVFRERPVIANTHLVIDRNGVTIMNDGAWLINNSITNNLVAYPMMKIPIVRELTDQQLDEIVKLLEDWSCQQD